MEIIVKAIYKNKQKILIESSYILYLQQIFLNTFRLLVLRVMKQIAIRSHSD